MEKRDPEKEKPMWNYFFKDVIAELGSIISTTAIFM
jgi:hypothetical protein